MRSPMMLLQEACHAQVVVYETEALSKMYCLHAGCHTYEAECKSDSPYTPSWVLNLIVLCMCMCVCSYGIIYFQLLAEYS